MTERRRISALVSVHDVMPETLPAVRKLLGHLSRRNLTPITLLIVPGKPWTLAQIAQLREWQVDGAMLAGHGWTHRVERIRGIGHRLHSALISRRAGEHLSLDGPQIEALITRNHAWFREHDLHAPGLYVPPAWAMGELDRARLGGLPFRWYETLTGVYDALTGRFLRLPLMGFEAHPPLRPTLVRLWNAVNLKAARPAAPVRIGIHPNDLSLPLGDDLLALLDLPLACRPYDELQ